MGVPTGVPIIRIIVFWGVSYVVLGKLSFRLPQLQNVNPIRFIIWPYRILTIGVGVRKMVLVLYFELACQGLILNLQAYASAKTYANVQKMDPLQMHRASFHNAEKCSWL